MEVGKFTIIMLFILHQRVQRCDYLRLGFADGKSADRDPGRIHFRNERRRPFAQVCENASLDDPEERLIRAFFRFQAAFQPAVRPVHRGDVIVVVERRGAFVKRHDNIRTEILLDRDRFFRGEAMGRTVEMRPEGDPLFVDFPQLVQREDLKPAGVGVAVFNRN